MTRDWAFTLTNASQVYNLWTLIAATITDPSLFVPSQVAELEIQNQTAGATVSRSTGSVANVGFQLTGGSWDITRLVFNGINLKSLNFSTDTAGTVLYVQVTAK